MKSKIWQTQSSVILYYVIRSYGKKWIRRFGFSARTERGKDESALFTLHFQMPQELGEFEEFCLQCSCMEPYPCTQAFWSPIKSKFFLMLALLTRASF